MDAVRAPPVSRDYVFRTFNDDVWSKYRSEEVDFCDAKAFAGGGSRADWTVVLD